MSTVLADGTDEEEVRKAVAAVNRQTRRPLRFQLLAGELETAALRQASDDTCASLAASFGDGAPTDRTELIAWLRNKSHKGPWMRALIGDRLPWTELDRSIASVLTAWMDGHKEAISNLKRLRDGESI